MNIIQRSVGVIDQAGKMPEGRLRRTSSVRMLRSGCSVESRAGIFSFCMRLFSLVPFVSQQAEI